MQNDLISRSALIDQLERLAAHEDAWRQSCILGIVRTIDNAPAVDAVEVVRRKCCKHCFLDLSGRDYHLCMKNGFLSRNRVQEDDFCSYGERRTDDGK